MRAFILLLAHISCQQLCSATNQSAFEEVYPTIHEGVGNNNSVPLYFGLMLSLSGDDHSNGALDGVRAALDEINSRDDLLPGYSLHYILADSKVCVCMWPYRLILIASFITTVQQNSGSWRTFHTVAFFSTEGCFDRIRMFSSHRSYC